MPANASELKKKNEKNIAEHVHVHAIHGQSRRNKCRVICQRLHHIFYITTAFPMLFSIVFIVECVMRRYPNNLQMWFVLVELTCRTNVSKRKRAVSPFSRWFNQFRSDFFRSLFLHLLGILFGNLFVCFLVHYSLRSINMLAGEMFNDCNRKSCSNFQTSAVIRITRCIMCVRMCAAFFDWMTLKTNAQVTY